LPGSAVRTMEETSLVYYRNTSSKSRAFSSTTINKLMLYSEIFRIQSSSKQFMKSDNELMLEVKTTIT
jgi:hypothetical protein